MTWAWLLGLINFIVIIYCLFSGTAWRGVNLPPYTRKENPIAYWSIVAVFCFALVVEVSYAFL